MNLEQQAEAQEIALVAVGLVRQEREAYLRRRIAGDPEILAEVRRRLELAGRMPEDFLDRPAGEIIDDGTAAGRPPGVEAAELAAAAELRELPFAEGRRYRITEVLGAGGMAVVFRAFDRRLERPVAIKHLRDALAEDPRALKRFEREARAIARVNHPGIVQIFDVLHDRDDLWIVMELVPGEPLASRLAQGPLELAEALWLAAGVADGLAAAHARGIVHRDLKAANVMVTPAGDASAGRASAGRASAGRVKILDFGLASSMLSDDDSPRAGGLYGTPSAMSPEQVSRSRVDFRSDLFSFGALLYRMVTGEPAFAGCSPLMTLEQVCRSQPTPARRLNPRVPEELSSLIEALLEKDRGRRPRDTAVVARTLARLAKSTTGAVAIRNRRGDSPPDAASAAFPSAAAEVRQVTVVSCQLVAAGGSGRLLEAEELLAVEAPFRELAMPILERCRAHQGECSDAGLMAYFGFPRAREDDPQRGISAALELAAAVEQWNSGPDGPATGVSLRVGINTGPVVVATRPDGGQEVVLGRTGCCAAEMMTPAASTGVLVSEATHRLVCGRFRFQPLGVCPLARCRQPFELYRVLAATPADSEEDEAGELTPFVGRDSELELLHQRWCQAAEGRGRAVLVSGEAGSGKSRLLQTFHRLLASTSGPWLEVSCRPAASPVPLFWRLSRRLGSEAEEEPGALVKRLTERADGGTMVLAIEDAHLADASDLDLLGLMIDQAPAARLLILLTCCPPFVAPWKLPLHLTAWSLAPLAAGQVKQMIRHLTAGRALPAGVEEQILDAADGVPRFVEELTLTMLGSEASAAAQIGGIEVAGPRPPTAVPAALKSSLTARLDRLGSAREVARVASVLGREFTLEQLSALVPTIGDAVEDALDRLVDAEILQRPGGRRRATYRFRHALDRAAACESLIGEHLRLYQRRAQDSSSSSSRAASRSGRSAPSVNQP